MFRLSRDGCTSLSVASILTRPFTILYIKTSLAERSGIGHCHLPRVLNPSRLTYLIKLIKLFLLAHLFCTALYC
jgi:hypothetical protein